MKALSIQQPFIYFILTGDKPEEYRTWKTNYRGDILLCSSLGVPSDFRTEKEKFPRGYALGVVELVDIKFNEEFEEYDWILDNIRLIKPFPAKGKLNLFEVDTEIEFLKKGEIIEKYWHPLIKDTNIDYGIIVGRDNRMKD